MPPGLQARGVRFHVGRGHRLRDPLLPAPDPPVPEGLAPGGRVWLAEPKRSVSLPVWERLAGDGFDVRKLFTETVPVEGYHVTVNLWELTLPRVEA